MRSRHPWWMIYAACIAVVTMALGWVTVVLLQLERSEQAAPFSAIRSRLGRMRQSIWQLLKETRWVRRF